MVSSIVIVFFLLLLILFLLFLHHLPTSFLSNVRQILAHRPTGGASGAFDGLPAGRCMTEDLLDLRSAHELNFRLLSGTSINHLIASLHQKKPPRLELGRPKARSTRPSPPATKRAVSRPPHPDRRAPRRSVGSRPACAWTPSWRGRHGHP